MPNFQDAPSIQLTITQSCELEELRQNALATLLEQTIGIQLNKALALVNSEQIFLINSNESPIGIALLVSLGNGTSYISVRYLRKNLQELGVEQLQRLLEKICNEFPFINLVLDAPDSSNLYAAAMYCGFRIEENHLSERQSIKKLRLTIASASGSLVRFLLNSHTLFKPALLPEDSPFDALAES